MNLYDHFQNLYGVGFSEKNRFYLGGAVETFPQPHPWYKMKFLLTNKWIKTQFKNFYVKLKDANSACNYSIERKHSTDAYSLDFLKKFS